MAARIVVLGVLAAATILIAGFTTGQGWIIAVGMAALSITFVIAFAWPNHNPLLPPPPPSAPSQEPSNRAATWTPIAVLLAVLAGGLVLSAGFLAQQGWMIAVGMGAIGLVLVIGLVTSSKRSTNPL